MKEATKLPELPRLPKGQGTLIYTHGNKILYRKAIPVDGGYKRLAVTGNNIRECFDTMRRKEDDLRAGMKSAGSESLAMAITDGSTSTNNRKSNRPVMTGSALPTKPKSQR